MENNALKCDVAAETDGAKIELVLDDMDGDLDKVLAFDLFGLVVAGCGTELTIVEADEDVESLDIVDFILFIVDVFDKPGV